jgi:amino acid transporter
MLLGGACALAALCYAELASMIPQAGSAYAYSYATLGELAAWIIGWDLILEYAVGNDAVARRLPPTGLRGFIRAPPLSFSPISGSTPFPRPQRKQRIHSATFPSASSGAWASAR